MSSFDHRLGVFAISSALISAFFFIVDIGETPRVFENWRLEVAFLLPILLWQVGRRLRLWQRDRAF